MKQMDEREIVSTEALINEKCRRMLKDAGVKRKGQSVRVHKGTWEGLEGRIGDIAWTEAEIRLEGHPRWFGVDFFKVL